MKRMTWIVTLALPLLLGNEGKEGCEENQELGASAVTDEPKEVTELDEFGETFPASGRRLKKLVEVGFLQSQPMNLANGENFDFGFVANAQMFDLLRQSDRFVMPGRSREMIRSGEFVSAEFKEVESTVGHSYVRPANAMLDAACLLDSPQVVISGAVQSFQLTSQTGIRFGFGPIGRIGFAIPAARLAFSRAQLDLSLEAEDRWDRIVVGAAQGTATQTSRDIDLSINFGLFSFGPRYYFESPLATVTRTALSSAILSVAQQLDEEPWHARLVEDRDTHVIIDAGSRAGLTEGDVLEVYNETHRWKGKPCESEYDRSVPGSIRPVAVGRVVRTTPMAAIVEITEQGFQNPAVGARVTVRELARRL